MVERKESILDRGKRNEWKYEGRNVVCICKEASLTELGPVIMLGISRGLE